jgi:hypothetical protein
MGTGKVGLGSLPHSAQLPETVLVQTKDLPKHIPILICGRLFAVLGRAADYIHKVG